MDKIYIYLFNQMDSLDESFTAEHFYKLPEFRRKQCIKYRRESDKKACIIAYHLLEKGLAERYGITSSISFVYNENGKPYLREHPNVFFSISHSESGVICALAEFEIGADMENIRPFDMKMAELVCSDDEFRELSISVDPARLFCRFWTEKESYAKAKGMGMASDLRQNIPKDGFLCIDMRDYLITLYCGKSDLVPISSLSCSTSMKWPCGYSHSSKYSSKYKTP